MEQTTNQPTTVYYTGDQLYWWGVDFFEEDKRAEIVSTHRSKLPLAIHMSCWKLAQWVLGPSLLDHNNNLELFAGLALRFSIRQSLKWYGDDEEDDEEDDEDPLFPFYGDTSKDPYRIPKVQQLLTSSREEKKKKKRRPR
jgi:hypothetical protein